ncbi:F-box/WD repeat-containing protein lin-23 [Thelohanellus kitauei]|uniref:F-box/WD repeat-containing protein lin-23 n=1 Tax=Thelohanellus kitauei TaxID=669202 RepID=A0A0C2MXF3_THEKT|nr:F-box/WD repeat-containing protein lin-23 [Thelohanellus kitauei]
MGHTAPVMCMQINDSRLYSGSCDKSIRVWSLELFRCLSVISGNISAVKLISVFASRLISVGKVIFSIIQGARVALVWNLMSKKAASPKVLDKHASIITAIAQDHQYIVTACSNSRIVLWRSDTLEMLTSINDYRRGIKCLSYIFPFIFTVSSDRALRVVDIRTKTRIFTSASQTENIRSLAVNENILLLGTQHGHALKFDITHMGLNVKPVEKYLDILNEREDIEIGFGPVYSMNICGAKILYLTSKNFLTVYNYLDSSWDHSSIRKSRITLSTY